MLKCSHAFNLMDNSRNYFCSTDRAGFVNGRIRKMARTVMAFVAEQWH